MTSPTVLRAGTRRSKLAMRQTQLVVDALRASHPSLQVEIVPIVTTGDRVLDVPLTGIGDRGVFVREIEQALLDGEIDFAVHSLKDLPGVQPEGLCLAAIPEREDVRDLLISRVGPLDQLPEAARVGTSSLRRSAQLRHHRPDLQIQDIRGNVDTRLAKLQAGGYDAIVLAAAGMNRLGISDHTAFPLPFDVMLPAVGQGALGIEARAGDERTHQVLAAIDHAPTAAAVRAERAFLRTLEGGCQVPLAAHARVSDGSLRLEGLLASVDGKQLVRDVIDGAVAEAEALGTQLAERLLAAGGERILAELRRGA